MIGRGELTGELRNRLSYEYESERVELTVESLLVAQQLVDLLLGHARSVVVDSQHDAIPFDCVAGVDHAAVSPLHGVHGIHDQIEVHASESGLIPADPGGIQPAEQ